MMKTFGSPSRIKDAVGALFIVLTAFLYMADPGGATSPEPESLEECEATASRTDEVGHDLDLDLTFAPPLDI